MPRNDRVGSRPQRPTGQQAPEFDLESILGSGQSAALIQQVANAAAKQLAQAGLQGLPPLPTPSADVQSSMGSSGGLTPSGSSTGKPEAAAGDGKKKGSHSEIERRRRDLINERIEELRRMVPDAAASKGNKASVLGDAIEHMSNLQDENARLQREKDAMMVELERLRVTSLTDAMPHTDAAIAKRKRRMAEDGGRPDAFIDAVTARQVHYEAIATIGAVQNYGLLVAVRDNDWTIAQVSNNAESLLSIPTDQLLNRKISALFDEESVRVVQSAVGEEGEIRVTGPVLLTTVRHDTGERVIWDGMLHRASSCVILELEPFARDLALAFSDSGRIRAAMENLENASGVEELCQILAQEVSDITGYDRVMVYRFGAEGHGKVLAEVLRKSGLEPYLGLNFPSTDIPTVARNLFVLNRVRVIADTYAKPAEVYPPVSPVTERPLDMSKSVLRAVSRCHTQYLKNMGVAASISNAIVKDKKLWGLFICYSYSPKRLSFEHREACILLSRVLSALLARKEQQETRQHVARAKEIQSQFLDGLLMEGRFPDALYAARPSVFDVLDCGGAAVCTRARGLATFGRTPSAVDIRDLVEWLNSNMTEEVWSTDCLSESFEGAVYLREVASGLLAVSLSSTPGDYAMWFRPEVVQEENWGGPLKEAIIHGENGALNPRASFQKFSQLVRGRAPPFSQRDLTCARALRMTVLDAATVGLCPPSPASTTFGESGRESALRRLHEKVEAAGNELLGIFQQEVDTLMETMPLPLIAVDRDLRITDWNVAAAKLTGLPRAEMLGAHVLGRAFDGQPAVRDLLERALRDAPAAPARPQSAFEGLPASPPMNSPGSPASPAPSASSAPEGAGLVELAASLRTKVGRVEVAVYAAPRRDADGAVVGVMAVMHPIEAGPPGAATEARALSHSLLFELVKKWLPCFNAVHIAASRPALDATPSYSGSCTPLSSAMVE